MVIKIHLIGVEFPPGFPLAEVFFVCDRSEDKRYRWRSTRPLDPKKLPILRSVSRPEIVFVLKSRDISRWFHSSFECSRVCFSGFGPVEHGAVRQLRKTAEVPATDGRLQKGFPARGRQCCKSKYGPRQGRTAAAAAEAAGRI